jgi:hypothetical protein
MSKKYPNKFNIYKNCRSVYMFNKQSDGTYKVINKVKNGYNRYVRYGGICYVKPQNLNYFVSNKIYYSINSLGIDRQRQF